MDEYIELFFELMNFKEKINVTTHVYSSKSEMHKARIEMTKDELLKAYLKSDRCTQSDGCYIIPPVNDKEYDVLLVDSELIVYNLWHEMVHVYNYYNVMQKGCDYMMMCTNATYYNWDEYRARKLSTIMWFEFLAIQSGEKYESQDFFDGLAETLRKEVKESELLDADIFKYNLMQYLGFVSAVEEICKDFFVLPSFIAETPSVLKQYNDLKEK